MAEFRRLPTLLFASYLNYMNPIWGTACDNVIQPIQVIQNRIVRNMYGFDRRLDNAIMYEQLTLDNIFPIRAINYITTASFIYSCRKRSIHSNISFELNQLERHRMTLRTATAKNNIGKKDIKHFGVNIYNNLPDNIKKQCIFIHSSSKQNSTYPTLHSYPVVSMAAI